MRVIEPSVELIGPADGEEILRRLELAGRVCYKSEDRITADSAARFVRGILKSQHESVIEHVSLSARLICDRGVSHEIVRHRLASYSQESTRYCNYTKGKFGGELTFIRPCFWQENTPPMAAWEKSCQAAEDNYFALIKLGAKPEEARGVLPNSLKTELVMTANLREWRHFFRLRTAAASHPQMRQLAKMLLAEMRAKIPVLFDDIGDSEG